jgi:hypothetical protein
MNIEPRLPKEGSDEQRDETAPESNGIFLDGIFLNGIFLK